MEALSHLFELRPIVFIGCWIVIRIITEILQTIVVTKIDHPVFTTAHKEITHLDISML